MRLDPHYGNLRLVDLADSDEWQCLRALIQYYPQCDDLPTVSGKAQFLHGELCKWPHRRLIELIDPRNPRSIGARWCIVEKDYVDRGSSIAFARLYSRAFRYYPRRAIRLHFFSETLPVLDYGDLLREGVLDGAYLGYLVISPSGAISKTVLPPFRDPNYLSWAIDRGSHTVNLAGVLLHAHGAAFIQADHRIAACASAAAWMSTESLPAYLDHDVKAHSMAEITELAVGGLNIASLRNGLTADQLLEALHTIGYEPTVYHSFEVAQAADLIGQAIESAIPPILILRLPHHPNGKNTQHAITAVGLTHDPSLESDPFGKGGHYTHQGYPHILVHDDQKGPYIKLSLDSPNSFSGAQPSVKLDIADGLIKPLLEHFHDMWYRDAYLDTIILPLPPRHAGLSPEYVLPRAGNALLTAFLILGERFESLWFPLFPAYRAYFISSNDWKRGMLPETHSAGRPKLKEELSNCYRGQTLSKYIWVVEVFASDRYLGLRPGDRRVVADVVLDPTADPLGNDFHSIHLPGLFVRMPPEETDPTVAFEDPFVIPGDTPFDPGQFWSRCQVGTL